MYLILPYLVAGQVLPVYFLRQNRSSLLPDLTITTQNYAALVPSVGGRSGYPEFTQYVRAGNPNLPPSDCFRLASPYARDTIRLRWFVNATFTLALKENLPCAEVFVTGWGGIPGICTTNECVDVTIVGSTQVGSLAGKGALHPLDDYFNDYATETGEIFSDKIIPKFSYDYKVGNYWMGLPIIVDLRMFYYNRTVFDMLNLKYPPPHAQWEEGEWNWKKMAEYLTTIKNGGIRTTFDFYLEEYQLLAHAARNYGGQMINSRKECGYRVPGIEAFHNEVLYPIFGPNGTANNNWLWTDDDRFTDFLAKPLQDPLTQPVFWKSWAFSTPYTVEFNSIFNGHHQRNIFHPVSYPNGVVGQALMPGKSTFLGGAGAAITAKSNKKELGWKFLQMLASPTYQRLMNQGLESPYTAVLESSREWSLPESDAVRMQFSRAVPPQYPQNAFSQSAELEARAPWRAYLVEMAYKNASFPVLIDRLCKVIDYVMLPICSAEHMTIQDKGCNPVSLTRNLTYVWNTAKPCRDGIALPNAIELTCPVVTVFWRLLES